MTNEMLIWNERIRLFESGKIGGTGRMIELHAEDGTVKKWKSQKKFTVTAGGRNTAIK